MQKLGTMSRRRAIQATPLPHQAAVGAATGGAIGAPRLSGVGVANRARTRGTGSDDCAFVSQTSMQTLRALVFGGTISQ